MPTTVDGKWTLYFNQLEQYVKLLEEEILMKNRLIAGLPEEDDGA